MRTRLGLVAALTMVIAMIPTAASAATYSATIDFEGLGEGTIVLSLSNGSGISGDNIGGSVGVSATGGSGDAMIFDSNCTGGCSGSDPDLQSNSGNVLIVSHDGDTSDPDDWVNGGNLSFSLPGSFLVKSIQITDFGDSAGTPDGSITVGGSSVSIPAMGNGAVQTVAVNLTGTSIDIESNDSYSVDNIMLEWEVPDGPGTGTQGYWRNHPDAWPGGVNIGGVAYTVEQAIEEMDEPGRGDKTYDMFDQLVAAVLNVAVGNDDSCIADTIADAQAWMVANPLGSNVRANSDAWQDEGSALHSMLDAYNNGLLCAPSRD